MDTKFYAKRIYKQFPIYSVVLDYKEEIVEKKLVCVCGNEAEAKEYCKVLNKLNNKHKHEMEEAFGEVVMLSHRSENPLDEGFWTKSVDEVAKILNIPTKIAQRIMKKTSYKGPDYYEVGEAIKFYKICKKDMPSRID